MPQLWPECPTSLSDTSPSSQASPRRPPLPFNPRAPHVCQASSPKAGKRLWGTLRTETTRRAISNSECLGQLPRLCSTFWCSVKSSHHIAKKSTAKPSRPPSALNNVCSIFWLRNNVWPICQELYVKHRGLNNKINYNATKQSIVNPSVYFFWVFSHECIHIQSYNWDHDYRALKR